MEKAYVTYSDLFKFVMMLTGIVALCYIIFTDEGRA